jgi:hypothetical protein
LPSGKELEKLTEIQGIFKRVASIDSKPYYEKQYGSDNADAFLNTELPKLIAADAEPQAQCLHDDCLIDLAIEAA